MFVFVWAVCHIHSAADSPGQQWDMSENSATSQGRVEATERYAGLIMSLLSAGAAAAAPQKRASLGSKDRRQPGVCACLCGDQQNRGSSEVIDKGNVSTAVGNFVISIHDKVLQALSDGAICLLLSLRLVQHVLGPHP